MISLPPSVFLGSPHSMVPLIAISKTSFQIAVIYGIFKKTKMCWDGVGAMISEDSLKEISSIFCGDTGDFYVYKSGPKLVSFFNQHFGFNDIYAQGFPSRWAYTFDKIAGIINSGKTDEFFSLILSKEYILAEQKSSEVDAIERVTAIYAEFNRILKSNMLTLTKQHGKYFLTKESEDLVYIGGGGFANVYLQKSTGKVLKKLKEDYLMDAGIRSRFKREYNITKSLSDMPTIIKVFDFDEGSCTYTMEKAEKTLEQFFRENDFSEEYKITCIRQIMHTMKNVHDKDVIHRDISPNNIFVLSGLLKIADFGLGKDLHMFTSHNTYLTNAVGQFRYCAPEQFMMLKDGDKRSDVYSLGRLINFIMTGDSANYHHIFKAVTEKATSTNVVFRQADAGVLLDYIEKSIKYHAREQNQEVFNEKIAQGVLDSDVENYISELTGEQICKLLISEKQGFSSTLIRYMEQDPTHASDVVQMVEDNFREECHGFADYDPFARLTYAILLNDALGFTIKEIAAGILRYVAYDVNRFNAQSLLEKVVEHGVEPMIEDILQR